MNHIPLRMQLPTQIPRWSPDGTRIAVRDAEGIQVFDGRTFRAVPVPVSALGHWHQDGILALHRQALVDAPGSERLRVMRINPDNATVAEIYMIDAVTGGAYPEWRLTGVHCWYMGLFYSTDGKEKELLGAPNKFSPSGLFYTESFKAQNSWGVQVFLTSTHELVAQFCLKPIQYCGLAWSADERVLLWHAPLTTPVDGQSYQEVVAFLHVQENKVVYAPYTLRRLQKSKPPIDFFKTHVIWGSDTKNFFVENRPDKSFTSIDAYSPDTGYISSHEFPCTVHSLSEQPKAAR